LKGLEDSDDDVGVRAATKKIFQKRMDRAEAPSGRKPGWKEQKERLLMQPWWKLLAVRRICKIMG